MSKNTSQQEQLEMGNRRSRSPAHEHATQAVAPKPDAAGVNNDNSRSSNNSQTSSNEPFVADQLNTERRVVLQLRHGFGGCSVKKIHAAFAIFNVAASVASFCPLPPFELKGELLQAFEENALQGKALTTTDRYALSRVTTVGDWFLNCSGFKTIDLTPLSNVTRIGDNFLQGCRGLDTIDLSPLSNVTTVGNDFLFACSGLKTIDLSPLSHVTTVGDCFLYCCSGLNDIDLSPLSNLTTVGDHFLTGCSSLNAIDLSPLSNVTAVGNHFLFHCRGFNTIDLSPLSNVANVGGGFLSECSGAVQAEGEKFLSRRRRKLTLSVL